MYQTILRRHSLIMYFDSKRTTVQNERTSNVASFLPVTDFVTNESVLLRPHGVCVCVFGVENEDNDLKIPKLTRFLLFGVKKRIKILSNV